MAVDIWAQGDYTTPGGLTIAYEVTKLPDGNFYYRFKGQGGDTWYTMGDFWTVQVAELDRRYVENQRTPAAPVPAEPAPASGAQTGATPGDEWEQSARPRQAAPVYQGNVPAPGRRYNPLPVRRRPLRALKAWTPKGWTPRA